MTRSEARKRLPRFRESASGFDDFCLFAGWGIRAAYPTARLLDSVAPARRATLAERIVIALTANPFYALDGVRPGMQVSEVEHRLHLGKPLRVGANQWYVFAGPAANGVFKVRAGVIQEVGLADRMLTTGRKALLSFFGGGI